jgi:hypothetical protein
MRAYLVSRGTKGALRAAFFGVVALVLPTQLFAQSGGPTVSPPGGVSCFLPPAKLPDSAVAKFTANPAGLLAENPGGGPALMSAARRLAGSDVRTVDALIEVARKAAPELRTDIATGLANTAASCAWTRPDIAQLIKEKIAAAGDAPLSTVFLSVLRAGGTPSLGGAAGPGRDIGPIGGSAVRAGGVEPSASPEVGTAEGPKFGRRDIDIGSTGSADRSGTESSNAVEAVDSARTLNANRRLFKPDAPVSPTTQ